MPARRDWLRLALIVALLLLGFAAKGLLVAPPSPPASAQAGEFDGQRAIGRLKRILGDERPHPVDSPANDAVRERLMAELRAIGLEPSVQEAVDCSALPKARLVSCSRVRNVIATIPARADGPHLLINAHYDSTPAGPGAADDGLGVATMLEVGAILRASPPPRPVTLLFNEGEEFGLNGASAFVREHPLAKRVNSLINIEARGVSGPALMFETSDPNGAAIAAYARATRRPYANSMSTDFARLIPNYTDVVEFRPAGWTLLNYSIIGNETRYHTPGDNIAALSPASLAHVGSEVLAATRVLAADPKPVSAGSGRYVFTDLAGRGFIKLPLLIAEEALGLMLIVAIYLGWRRRALGRPLLLAAAMAAGGAAAAALAAYAAGAVRAGDFYRAWPLVTYLGVYATMLAAMVAVWSRWGRRFERERMRAAAWLFVLLIGCAISVVVPGASIFFLIAPALALIGIGLSIRSPAAAAVLAVVATIIQFLMFAEQLALIEMLLVDGPLWAVAPLAAIVALPALVEAGTARARPALAIAAVAALIFWGAALILPRASADRPAAFAIDYFRDADRNKAQWGIATKQAPLPQAFPGEWKTGVLPYNMRRRWVADAPVVATPTPRARLVASEAVGNGRRIGIALSSGGADAVAIRFAKGTKLVALGLPGRLEQLPAQGEPEKPALRCSGRSCEGLVIEALLADRAPVVAELFATRFALPPQGAALVAARPRNAMPQYGADQSITLSRVRF